MIENSYTTSKEVFKTEKTLAPGEVVIGELTQINSLGQPLVSFDLNSNPQPLVAISTISVTQQQLGRNVVLMFTEGDLNKPIIIGLIHSPLLEMIENFELSSTQSLEEDSTVETDSLSVLDNTDTFIDGKKVCIEAQDEIVFKCGEASITLTKAGKIMIRGKYLLNRSTGVNRILGGSVQVN